jgi:hypothetical protein
MCIDRGSYHLTPGKIYSVKICQHIFDYYIVNDNGILHGVEKNLFIDLAELRLEKLKLLGI